MAVPIRGAAKRAMPSLTNFKHLHPRNQVSAFPPGGPLKLQGQYGQGDISHSIDTYYHDLGVLVYSGLNHGQTQRLGELIALTVKSGGPDTLNSSVSRHTTASPTAGSSVSLINSTIMILRIRYVLPPVYILGSLLNSFALSRLMTSLNGLYTTY